MLRQKAKPLPLIWWVKTAWMEITKRPTKKQTRKEKNRSRASGREGWENIFKKDWNFLFDLHDTSNSGQKSWVIALFLPKMETSLPDFHGSLLTWMLRPYTVFNTACFHMWESSGQKAISLFWRSSQVFHIVQAWSCFMKIAIHLN